MPHRSEPRQRRSGRPSTRRALHGPGAAVSLAAVVALTGASAAPPLLTDLSGSQAVAVWHVVGDASAATALDADTGEPVEEPIVREASDRATRETARRHAATLAVESSRRAATEAALTATEQVRDITRIPPPTPAWRAPMDGGYTLSSGFGPRWGKVHPAQDFAAPVGTPVRSPSNGTVVFAGWQGPYGYKVEIQLWEGTVIWFAHNSAIGVTQGQPVVTGQVVAASGDTGNSTGPHLHMEVHPAGGEPVPVMEWLAAHGIPM